MDRGPWWAAVHGVAKSRIQLSDFTFTFHFHALEKEMTTHCSVLAWRIPGTGEPGGLPSMGSHRVGHYWSDLAAAAAAAAFSLVSSEAINVHFKHNFISLQREKQTKKKKKWSFQVFKQCGTSSVFPIPHIQCDHLHRKSLNKKKSTLPPKISLITNYVLGVICSFSVKMSSSAEGKLSQEKN